MLKELTSKKSVRNIGSSSITKCFVNLKLKDAKIHRDMIKEIDQYVDESLNVAAAYEAD